MRVLAIDIGGTKSAVARCTVADGVVTSVVGLTKFASKDFRSLPDMINGWQEQNPKESFDAIGAGVAGPVVDGHVHLTNLGWDIDANAVSEFLNKPFRLCNDMEAHGWGLLGLTDAHRLILNKGTPGPGAKALIAAGTGLGESIIGWNGNDFHPMPGEGGHSSFSPANDLEDELLKFLRHELNGHVSWERVLGGRDGFRYLTRFLSNHRGLHLPTYILELPDSEMDWGPSILKAEAQGDLFAGDLLAIYATLYGREAANLALKCVPRSGIYLGGGIAPRIISALQANFMHGFTDKGRFVELLYSIPVYIIKDDLNGLKGAALQFCDTAK